MCDDELGRGGDASGRGRAMGFCPSGPGSNLGQTKSFFWFIIAVILFLLGIGTFLNKI